MRRTLLHRGAKFDFERVEYPGGSGQVLTREVIRHPGAVVILPVLERSGGLFVVMIRNQRIPSGLELWELPAGTREKGEAPEVTAARELVEETGYRAQNILLLSSYYTSPGLSDELMWAYLATGLEEASQDLEEDERITVEVVPMARVWEMLDGGELKDAKSMLALLAAARGGLIPGGVQDR